MSSLPFGIQPASDSSFSLQPSAFAPKSPLPFGVHCFPDKFCILHSAFCILHSAFCILHFRPSPLHFGVHCFPDPDSGVVTHCWPKRQDPKRSNLGFGDWLMDLAGRHAIGYSISPCSRCGSCDQGQTSRGFVT